MAFHSEGTVCAKALGRQGPGCSPGTEGRPGLARVDGVLNEAERDVEARILVFTQRIILRIMSLASDIFIYLLFLYLLN